MTTTITAPWTNGSDQLIVRMGRAVSGMTGGPKKPVNQRIRNVIARTMINMVCLRKRARCPNKVPISPRLLILWAESMLTITRW
jgi:hypothetical protein